MRNLRAFAGLGPTALLTLLATAAPAGEPTPSADAPLRLDWRARVVRVLPDGSRRLEKLGGGAGFQIGYGGSSAITETIARGGRTFERSLDVGITTHRRTADGIAATARVSRRMMAGPDAAPDGQAFAQQTWYVTLPLGEVRRLGPFPSPWGGEELFVEMRLDREGAGDPNGPFRDR